MKEKSKSRLQSLFDDIDREEMESQEIIVFNRRREKKVNLRKNKNGK